MTSTQHHNLKSLNECPKITHFITNKFLKKRFAHSDVSKVNFLPTPWNANANANAMACLALCLVFFGCDNSSTTLTSEVEAAVTDTDSGAGNTSTFQP